MMKGDNSARRLLRLRPASEYLSASGSAAIPRSLGMRTLIEIAQQKKQVRT